MGNTALIPDYRDYNNKMNIYSVTKIASLVNDLINIELVTVAYYVIVTYG